MTLCDIDNRHGDLFELRDWVSGEERKEIFPFHEVLLSSLTLYVICVLKSTESDHSHGII